MKFLKPNKSEILAEDGSWAQPATLSHRIHRYPVADHALVDLETQRTRNKNGENFGNEKFPNDKWFLWLEYMSQIRSKILSKEKEIKVRN